MTLQELDLTYQDSLRDGKAMGAVAADDEETAGKVREVFEDEDPERIEVLDATGQKIG